MHGHDVAEVQRLLDVDPDGVYGPITSGAVVAWKRSRGLDPSPVLSVADRERLMADVPLLALRTMERWAARGLAEQPPGSDRVPELVELAGRLEVAPEFGRMGYPWCAFAVFLAALASGGETAAAGLRRREFNPLYTPAVLGAARAGAFGLHVIRVGDAFRGDLVLFDWNLAGGDPADHVGRLAGALADGRVFTLDGNSGADGSIAVRERQFGSVRAFARDS